MKRILFGTAALVALGACASAPAAKTPAEMMLGTWTCKAESEGVTTNADVTYLEGGKTTMKAKVGVVQSGMVIDIDATGDATWKFLEDGKLQETITGMKVISGKMGGNDVPVAMIQPMVEQMVVNQSSTSTAVITPTTMTSTDDDGIVTSCTR
jgi:hypothetical protein